MSKREKTLLSSLLVVGALMGGTTVAMAAPPVPSVAITQEQQALMSRSMLAYRDNGTDVTAIYAVSEKTLRKEQIWAQQQQTPPSGDQVAVWLKNHGAKLDCPNGPALVERYADGSTYEAYFRNGQFDRRDGPAITLNYPSRSLVDLYFDGTTIEEYRRNGKLDRRDGPAIVERNEDGSTSEEYDRNGKLDRHDGPAIIVRSALGATCEQYFHNGKRDRHDGPAVITLNPLNEIIYEGFWKKGNFIREERPAPPSATPGVSAQPPTPGP